MLAAPSNVKFTVDSSSSSDQRLSSALGRTTTQFQVAKAFGAPDGSTIEMTASGSRVYASISHPSLSGSAKFTLERNESGGLTMQGNSVFAKGKNSRGEATAMVIKGAAYGRANLGVNRIEVPTALGNARSTDTGSLTWAKIGLNKILSAAERATLPASLKGAKDLNTVMLTKAGVNWWRANRTSFKGSIDLREGSKGLILARRAAGKLGISF